MIPDFYFIVRYVIDHPFREAPFLALGIVYAACGRPDSGVLFEAMLRNHERIIAKLRSEASA